MSLKLLSQCLTSGSAPSFIAVNHNHSNKSADGVTICMCVAGAKTEVIAVVGGAAGTTDDATNNNNINGNGKNNNSLSISTAVVKGADGAKSLCGFGSDGFLVSLPNGAINLIMVKAHNHEDTTGASSSPSSSSSSPPSSSPSPLLTTRTTRVGQHPIAGGYFTCLASAASSSTLPASTLLSQTTEEGEGEGEEEEGKGATTTTATHHQQNQQQQQNHQQNGSLSSLLTALTYAASRDEIFRIDAARGTVTSLGRVAGTAGLPITSLTVVPENPFIIIAAVHNRLLQLDVRESRRVATSSSSSSSSSSIAPAAAAVLCPQRSWLFPPSYTTTAATKVTSVSVSGTWLAAGSSDGRMAVWDARRGNCSSSSGAALSVGGSSTVIGSSSSSSCLLAATAPPTDVLQIVSSDHFTTAFGSSGTTTAAITTNAITTNAAVGGYTAPLNPLALYSNNASAAIVGPKSMAMLASSSSSSCSPFSVTSCSLIGAGTIFTTDARGYAKVWLRPSPSLPFESVTLCPTTHHYYNHNSSSSSSKLSGSATNSALFSVASAAIKCGAVGSRAGGNLVFAMVDDLGVVSVFGEQL